MAPINWLNIETVLLDMDGTLLDLNFDNVFWLKHLPQRYAEIHNLDLQIATNKLHQQFNEKKGSLNWYCLDYWSQQLDVDIVALKREVQHLIAERPSVREFLGHLKCQNIQRVLITNAHPESLQLKLSITGLASSLDSIISSHSYNAPKESQHFWQQLKKNIDFNPEKTLFIDDSEDILNAAGQFGITKLVSIRQPDSTQAPGPIGRYQAIINFNEIFC